MPTTRFKNFLYRTMLPLFAYDRDFQRSFIISGHPVSYRKDFQKLIKKHHVLGSSVLIADKHNCSLLYAESSSASQHPDPSTYYRVASITKMATAVLVLRLVDSGMLDLDSPVVQYLPDASLPSAVTLRLLLSHTSGLSDPSSLERDLEEETPLSDVVGRSLLHEPGTVFRYSNLGYGLIGCVLEAVLNKPVGQIFQEFLFTPLKMKATLEGCLLPIEQIMPVKRIFPYRENQTVVLTPLGKIPLLSPDPLRHYGHTAGSMYIQIDSLRILLQLLSENPDHFLSDRALAEMKKQHASYGNLSPTLSYGLGLLFIKDLSLSDGRIIGHQGFAYGCADGAFLEEKTGNLMIFLNGGCSEARVGRLGAANRDMLNWALRKELPSWRKTCD